jgi:hypothetical protein
LDSTVAVSLSRAMTVVVIPICLIQDLSTWDFQLSIDEYHRAISLISNGQDRK